MCSHSSMEWLRLVLLFAVNHQEKCSTPHIETLESLLCLEFSQFIRERF